ncbi:MAG: S8 family serine peptidase, partial [Caldilineaceae bacterium]|nr:S8 family serine peptidase [Caldilineaceae bacterium]
MRLRSFFRLTGPVTVALLAIGLLQWGLLTGAPGHGRVLAAPALDVGKPVDPNAAAWRLWQDLDPAAQAKIDPRLIDEFQGEVTPAHLSNNLATGLPLARTRFLVYLTEQPDLARLESQLVIAGATNPRRGTLDLLVQAAQTSQAPVRAVLDRQVAEQAVGSYQPLFIVNAVAVEGDLMTVIDLARRDDVSHIAANYPLVPLWQDDAPTGPNASPVTSTQSVTGPVAATVQSADLQTATVLDPANWNIDLVDADRVWTELGVTGQGAVVAGFDTGVYYAHPALIDAYRGTLPAGQFDHNYNWFEPDGNLYANGDLGPSLSPEPTNCGSHGTHTMGTMLGDDGQSNQIGMAPDAQWIGCRNMRRGIGNPASYSTCMEFFLAP